MWRSNWDDQFSERNAPCGLVRNRATIGHLVGPGWSCVWLPLAVLPWLLLRRPCALALWLLPWPFLADPSCPGYFWLSCLPLSLVLAVLHIERIA